MKKDKIFEDIATLNKVTYDFYHSRLCELAMSRFQWNNLPQTIDERFLELTLLQKGFCLFFEDEVIGYLTLPCNIGGSFDVYQIPINRWAYAFGNDYSAHRTKQDSVIIYNNYAHSVTFSYIDLFARRLAECERTVDVNVKAQKTPVLLLSDEKQRLTLKNLYMQYNGNYPFIFGSKELDTTKVKSISTQAPYVADKITNLKQSIWSEALTWLGISNLNLDKKERLVTDEVNTNMGFVDTQRLTWLKAREQACDMINNKFGLNISVEFRENISAELPTDIPIGVDDIE